MFKFLRSSTRNEYKVLVRRIKTTTSRGGHFKKKKKNQTKTVPWDYFPYKVAESHTIIIINLSLSLPHTWKL